MQGLSKMWTEADILNLRGTGHLLNVLLPLEWNVEVMMLLKHYTFIQSATNGEGG